MHHFVSFITYSEWPEQGDALIPLFFNFTLECTIRKVQEKKEGLKLNGTNQFFFASDVKSLAKGIHIMNKYEAALIMLLMALV
jgi:hypothetical protein